MSAVRIEPHRVWMPIQLLAVWFAALVPLESRFLYAAVHVQQPLWACPTLLISAIVFVPLFLGLAFIMQTKFRTHLQDDPHFAAWLERKELEFKGFTPENVRVGDKIDGTAPSHTSGPAGDVESRRVGTYENQKGLFVVRDWLPSRMPGQVADIRIWLHQHGEGPLSRNEVQKVEYHLGPKFFGGRLSSNETMETLFYWRSQPMVLCYAWREYS